MNNNRLPMLTALLPMLVGVVLSIYFVVPLWVSLLLWGVAAALLCVRQSSVLALVMLFGFGCSLVGVHRAAECQPFDRQRLMVLRAEEPTQVRIECWQDAEGVWRKSRSRLYVARNQLDVGDRVVVQGGVSLFDRRDSGFVRSMLLKGVCGSVNLEWSRFVDSLESAPLSLGAQINREGLQHLDMLDISDGARGVVGAIVLGDRSKVLPEISDAYRRSGTAHLMAISGLHVGVIFLIFNYLLGWVAFFRWGHVVRSLLVVVAIWAFAATTGLSISVVRAAVMFSLLQFVGHWGRSYSSVNMLSITLFGLLVLDPWAIFDLSLQLSFLAVAAISVWYVPLSRLLYTRWWALNWVVQALLLGFVASVALAPLLISTFGYVALFSPLYTLPMLLTINVLLGATLLWLLLPFARFEPLFSWLIGWAADLQNWMAMRFAAIDFGVVEWSAPRGVVVIFYSTFILLSWLFLVKSEKN